MRRTMTLVLAIGLAIARRDALAAPVLAVGTTCDASVVATGGDLVVPMTLTGGGTPLSAVDFRVTFSPQALALSDVRAPAALAALDTFEVAWDGALLPPEARSPGAAQIAVAPNFAVPVPTLPDGAIAELVFHATTGTVGCEAITVDAAATVFSTPPLGTAVAGTSQSGGVQAGGVQAGPEVCDNCADDNGDGAIDLADASCASQPLTLSKIVKAPGTKPLKVRAVLSGAVTSLGTAVQLAVTTNGASVVCADVPVAQFKSKKKGKQFVFKGAGNPISRIVLATPKSGGTKVTAILKGIGTLGAGDVGVSLRVGDGAFVGSGVLRQKGKKLVFP
jgi:hypothetical protein